MGSFQLMLSLKMEKFMGGVMGVTSNLIQCWGYNAYGQSGGQTTSNIKPSEHQPIQIRGLAKAVECGHDSTCALLTSNEIQCWGRDHQGILGTPDDTNSIG